MCCAWTNEPIARSHFCVEAETYLLLKIMKELVTYKLLDKDKYCSANNYKKWTEGMKEEGHVYTVEHLNFYFDTTKNIWHETTKYEHSLFGTKAKNIYILRILL